MCHPIRFWLALPAAAIVLAACDDGASPDASRTPTIIQVAFGNKQQVIVGAITAVPLIVHVADANSAVLPNVSVRWASVGGAFLSYPERHLLVNPVIRTDRYGQAAVYFRPDLEGTLNVTATVGDAGLSAEFEIISTVSLDRTILFGPFLCARTPSYFQDARRLIDSSTVIVGATISFTLHYEDFDGFQCNSKLTSTQVPPGGESFSTDTIHPGETVRFKPQVAGTWVIEDVIHGGQIRLEARNR